MVDFQEEVLERRSRDAVYGVQDCKAADGANHTQDGVSGGNALPYHEASDFEYADQKEVHGMGAHWPDLVQNNLFGR